MLAKVLEYWAPTPLPEGDHGEEIAAPTVLRQLAKEEVEITNASGPPTSAAPRRKMRRAVKKIPLSKARLTMA